MTNAYVSYAKVVKKIYIIDISYVLVTNIFHDDKVIIYRVSKEKRHSFFMKKKTFYLQFNYKYYNLIIIIIKICGIKIIEEHIPPERWT